VDLSLLMQRLKLTKKTGLLLHFAMMDQEGEEEEVEEEGKTLASEARVKKRRQENLFKTKKSRCLAKLGWLRQNVHKTLHSLRVAFKHRYVTAVQAADIASHFPEDACAARASALVIMHQRVLDLENYLVAAEKLFSSKEGMELFIQRIGWLNVINPDHVDRHYNLNLENPDEHLMAEYLVHLACIEPGENWQEEHWSATRCIGQWELPLSWEQSEDGGPGVIPQEGFLTLRYYTGPGCSKPVVRRHWWQNTLLFDRAELYHKDLTRHKKQFTTAKKKQKDGDEEGVSEMPAGGGGERGENNQT
jgi:hypothetical protein